VTDAPARPREARVDVGGLQARYRVSGEGTPVLLVHGIGRSLEDWTEQHALIGPGYAVHSVDLPGFGRSEPLRDTYSLPALASFLEGFLDAVGIAEPAHLVGNSLGGAVVMQLSLQAPGRARSLALLNSAGFGREVALALRLLAVRPLGRLLLRPTRANVIRSERSVFHDPALATAERVELALSLATQPHASRVFLATARALGTFRGIRSQWRDELLAEAAAVGLPTLVVWGDKDLILPHHHLEAARKHLPHAAFHLFPDTGHMPQIERAEQLAGLLQGFWADSAT
jgi:pimeloyl-ACP methyl ester carboxylesterase